jgi:hypothetical protein
MYGPKPAVSASKLTFALVRAMRTVYHQQTKNPLGSLHRSPTRPLGITKSSAITLDRPAHQPA